LYIDIVAMLLHMCLSIGNLYKSLSYCGKIVVQKC